MDSVGNKSCLQQIIQEIDGARYVWPHIMDEIARNLPEYTWLTELLQVSLGDELQFRLVGRAGNNFALTQFMENLEASLFIRGVRLLSTDQIIDEVGETGVFRPDKTPADPKHDEATDQIKQRRGRNCQPDLDQGRRGLGVTTQEQHRDDDDLSEGNRH